MSSNQRKHERTPLRVQFKIWHESFGEAQVETRDVSEGGVYLITDSANLEMPDSGTVMKGQVQGVMDDAPVVTMEIVRIEPQGVGLKFVEDA
ncbi:MAG: PilZ domain-containing protein [Pseudomonadales bacterium]|nr:PilZ domain-containing protein [Pseudomonadales bacterium]